MLLSPSQIQRHLAKSITSLDAGGPHTALLITPVGQVLAWITRTTDDQGEEIPQTSEGPWLETPERLRLLLGLASQWEEDESQRVECELGRLLLTPINMPVVTPPPGALLPTIRNSVSDTLILVLNGSATAPWSVLSSKMDAFCSDWYAMQ